MKLYKLTSICLLMGAASAAQANLTIGAAVGASTELYKGYGSPVAPLPVINYERDGFFIQGLAAGYKMIDTPKNELSITTYYYLLRFKPSDSDDLGMKLLNKRRSTLMAGFSYKHTEQWGQIHTNLSADVLNNSDAILFDATYRYPIIMSSQWRLTPGVGALWANRKHNDYYFGVTQSESANSGIQAYSPGNSWSPYLELLSNYQLSDQWVTYMVGRATSLSNEINNSPMVSKDYNLTFAVGVNYRF